MIIILEGTEGGGKSTLAKKLQEQLDFEIEHRSKPNSQEEREQMYESYRQSILSGKNLIWDRCWYSEMVYGPIMREQSYIGMDEMYEFEELLANNGGAIIIYCVDDMVTQWERATSRGEEYVTDFNTFKQLYDSYEEMFGRIYHKIPVVRHEISKGVSIL